MKRMIKLYRFFKPIAVYTAYLYTFVTILYLCVYELSGRRFLFTPELLWGLFLFSLGSIGLQRLVFGPKRAARIWYPVRLFVLGSCFFVGDLLPACDGCSSAFGSFAGSLWLSVAGSLQPLSGTYVQHIAAI